MKLDFLDLIPLLLYAHTHTHFSNGEQVHTISLHTLPTYMQEFQKVSSYCYNVVNLDLIKLV